MLLLSIHAFWLFNPLDISMVFSSVWETLQCYRFISPMKKSSLSCIQKDQRNKAGKTCKSTLFVDFQSREGRLLNHFETELILVPWWKCVRSGRGKDANLSLWHDQLLITQNGENCSWAVPRCLSAPLASLRHSQQHFWSWQLRA